LFPAARNETKAPTLDWPWETRRRNSRAQQRNNQEEKLQVKESISLYYHWSALFFFFIKCKKYIDQKEQDKLAIQAGNQQNCTCTSKGNRLL
jgi:hypothetical protein